MAPAHFSACVQILANLPEYLLVSRADEWQWLVPHMPADRVFFLGDYCGSQDLQHRLKALMRHPDSLQMRHDLQQWQAAGF